MQGPQKEAFVLKVIESLKSLFFLKKKRMQEMIDEVTLNP